MMYTIFNFNYILLHRSSFTLTLTRCGLCGGPGKESTEKDALGDPNSSDLVMAETLNSYLVPAEKKFDLETFNNFEI